MSFFKKHTHVIIGCVFLCLIAVVFFGLSMLMTNHYVNSSTAAVVVSTSTTTRAEPVFVPSYVSTPEAVKGIYMTSWVAGTPSLRNKLVQVMDTTEVNSVVIDIKDYSGKIVFPIEDNPTLKAYGSEEVRVRDMQQFIDTLHKKGIYVIGRVAVFQDAYFVKLRPDLAVKNKTGTATWKDRKGISWIDPSAHEYWDYIVMITDEAHKIGFDEINFDYIRFPSDGNMEDISYPWSSTTPKATVLKSFFTFLQQHVSSGTTSTVRVKTSADLFGMTTTATDDMGIGQLLENTLPYFDYVSPMVYPSHYPPTFMGYKNPEQYPYQVVQYAMQSAVTREKKLATQLASSSLNVAHPLAVLRPWLQDFGLTMDYGAPEVDAQIKATNDVGLNSWLLWSASNKYTVSALKAE